MTRFVQTALESAVVLTVGLAIVGALMFAFAENTSTFGIHGAGSALTAAGH